MISIQQIVSKAVSEVLAIWNGIEKSLRKNLGGYHG